MILAYELERTSSSTPPTRWVVTTVQTVFPDILDEAKWGLDWIHKLHPQADQLFHQVADDRDHRGFKMPDNDNADYGWGPNSYRPVYFAQRQAAGSGAVEKPLNRRGKYRRSFRGCDGDGISCWKTDLKDPQFARKCLRAAETLYAMGKRQGYQQGNSFGAPYRYNEDTWADDMEYAAAELYGATKRKAFLDDAKRYAKLAGTTSWMEFETHDMGQQMSRHYQMYPFTNIGHFSLYPLVDGARGLNSPVTIAAVSRKSSHEQRRIPSASVFPFCGARTIWWSRSSQVHLYEKMTGDRRYHPQRCLTIATGCLAATLGAHRCSRGFPTAASIRKTRISDSATLEEAGPRGPGRRTDRGCDVQRTDRSSPQSTG